MGYNIYIGNAIIEYNTDTESTIDVSIERVEIDDAPEFGFGDISSKSNGRFPTYTAMSQFAETVGLYDLFLNKDLGFLYPHLGVKAISKDDLFQIQQAKKNWETTHPNCKNKLPYKSKQPVDIEEFSCAMNEAAKKYDWFYARLVWFEFWFDWALKNCQYPAIGNG